MFFWIYTVVFSSRNTSVYWHVYFNEKAISDYNLLIKKNRYPTPPSIDAINQPSTPPEVTTNQVQCISSSYLTVVPLSSDSCKDLNSDYLNLSSSLCRDESSVSTNAICIRGKTLY